MCGIAGAFRLSGKPVVAEEIVPMRDELTHRGPDDAGLFVSDSCGLGFRRLSIIDLDAGQQPVSNEDGSVHAVLNGEIYNFQELRTKLQTLGHSFRSRSDTEVLPHLYEEYGIGFVDHLRGMFAIALYDGKRDELILVRDRLGLKPFYYYQSKHRLLFGSEIKAFRKHPAMGIAPHLPGIQTYLALRYLPGEETWFEGVRKIPPAHLLVVNSRGIRKQRYWEIDYGAEEYRTRDDALRGYLEAFQDAVGSHLVSDVPIGLFLSGGMDSSSLLAAIVRGGQEKIQCFTADFGLGGDVDETGPAQAVARHFGVPHDVLTVGSAEIDLLEKIVWHLDEPIGDPAVIPTYLLAKAAAEQVKVVITGEGSDEINAGYQRDLKFQLYIENQKRIAAVNRLPAWMKRLPPLARRLEPWAPMLHSRSEAECFRRLDGFEFGEGLFLEPPVPPEAGMRDLESISKRCAATDPLERRLFFSRHAFMLEDLIPKVDRMTMAHGLEARVPFLDHHLVEATARIPGRWRIDTKTRRTKSILRDSMVGHLPESTLARGQHGFNVPLDRWFEAGLNQYMVSLLRDRRTASREVLKPEVLTALADSIDRTGRPAKSAWMVVMMEIWFRQNID